MSEAEFCDGLFIKPPREGAPDFVKGSVSIKRAELGNWLRQRDDEWINLDVKASKNDPDKWYVQVNTWKPVASDGAPDMADSAVAPDDIPF
tara:strand:+ start:449 stop:721 length:273 start_codon:yes stop_codon:yes gene_type:complete